MAYQESLSDKLQNWWESLKNNPRSVKYPAPVDEDYLNKPMQKSVGLVSPNFVPVAPVKKGLLSQSQ